MLPGMPRRSQNDINSAQAQALVDAALRGYQQLPPTQRRLLLALLVLGGIVAAVWYYRQTNRPSATAPPVVVAQGSPNLLLGNPSGATADPSRRDNYLMVEPYFALSYSDDRGEPNWVSWRLTAADLGSTPRRDEFHPDDALPPSFCHIVSHDYDRTGFDRGHLCPYADRQATEASGRATFAMTNMVPQAPNLNRKAWEHVESYCRELARHGHRLYVTAGPAGRGGRGEGGPRDVIGLGHVVVPADCWKVIVILDDDPGVDPDPATLPASTRVLAVDMPNDESAVGDSWVQFRTTTAAIERRTGLRFFDRLRPDVAEALRQRVDRMPVPEPRPRVDSW